MEVYGSNATTGVCTGCPLGAVCPGTVDLYPESGYWTSTLVDLDVYRCLKKGHCKGGVNSTCKLGHTGPLCSICAAGWAMSPDGCIDCSDSGTVNPTMLVIVFVVAVLLFGCVGYCIYQQFGGTEKTAKVAPSELPAEPADMANETRGPEEEVSCFHEFR